MTRKHFTALAEVVAGIEDAKVRAEVAEGIARVCKESNAAFSFTRFARAAGVEDAAYFAGKR